MKKVFIMMLIGLFSISVYAQKGEKSIGLDLGYGTEIKSLGIGAKFSYNITDPIQLSPSFNYFLKKDGVSAWEINADAHYLFPVAEKLSVYPLVGLTLTGWKLSSGSDMDDLYDELKDYMDEDDYGEIDSSSTTKFGINLGGGISYDISKNMSIGGELKYSLVSDFDQLVIMANVMYKF